jgi:hypothetical protein
MGALQRYSALFAAGGRDKRLAQCRKLIGQAHAKASVNRLPSPQDTTVSELDEESEDEAFTGTDEEARRCHCRYCSGKLKNLGPLETRPTMQLLHLFQAIRSLLPIISTSLLQQLLLQIRYGKIVPKLFPLSIRRLLRKNPLTFIEQAAMEAIIYRFAPETRSNDSQDDSPIESVSESDPSLASNHLRPSLRSRTSGIPPPAENLVALEDLH